MVNKNLIKKALSMALRYSCKDLDEVYLNHSWYGIIFMQYINIYLCKYGGSVGYVGDLENMVPKEEKKSFMNFVSWLKRYHHLCEFGHYFYLPLRNSVLGYSPRPTKDNIAYMSLLRGKNTYECPFSLSEINLFLSKIVDEITAPLSDCVLSTIREMQQRHNNANTEMFVRLTSYYLRHSTNMIGLLSDKDVTANIVDIEKKYLSYFIKDDPYINIDENHNIFYNSRLRKMYGFPDVPQDYEIKTVRLNYNSRVDFMSDII